MILNQLDNKPALTLGQIDNTLWVQEKVRQHPAERETRQGQNKGITR